MRGRVNKELPLRSVSALLRLPRSGHTKLFQAWHSLLCAGWSLGMARYPESEVLLVGGFTTSQLRKNTYGDSVFELHWSGFAPQSVPRM